MNPKKYHPVNTAAMAEGLPLKQMQADNQTLRRDTFYNAGIKEHFFLQQSVNEWQS